MGLSVLHFYVVSSCIHLVALSLTFLSSDAFFATLNASQIEAVRLLRSESVKTIKTRKISYVFPLDNSRSPQKIQ